VLVAAALLGYAFNTLAERSAGAWRSTAVRFPVTLLIVIGAPVAAFLAMGAPLEFEYPQAGRFNVSGGVEVLPELVALLFGLVIYTAAFIAEVVRAGLMSVSHGQTEAAQALGLRRVQTLRLIVIPQAMRVIIPPLTSQYLNLTKNSSLAVAIGYPDLVQIFTGTVLNITGQAIEVVVITMAVYLSFSLITSLVMNAYNARVAVVER
jgi:general L-amino acid transport system permease protein